MVRGTRDNVRALMREDQTILVFPGGSREVNKRRGQQYRLLWGERMGFARLALEHGYPIVPCAAVGADDMLDVIVDQTTPLYGQLALAYERIMGFPTPPVVRGVGPTPIPRPERLYFWFGALVFMASTTELTATLLLAPTGTRTLATGFWAASSSLDYGTAAPYAVTMVALSAPMTWLLMRQRTVVA